MATFTKGITLSYAPMVSGAIDGEYTILTNLQEIGELGGETDSIEVTTLADSAHVYVGGLKNYGDSLTFKFLYEREQFLTLQGFNEECAWRVNFTDDLTCDFKGGCSVKLDSVAVNSALTYTLSIKPSSEMEWSA